MPTYKTPDVYIEEISVFPPSVAEVATAIPAFLGYTKTALGAGRDLKFIPTKIYSFKEYEQYFGQPKDDALAVEVKDDGQGGFALVTFTAPEVKYLMYYSVKQYFDNGGGQCYIVSVGGYQDPAQINKDDLVKGLDAVRLEDEPTLLVIPEAVKFAPTKDQAGKDTGSSADYGDLAGKVLDQCFTLKDRFVIFDLYSGDQNLDDKPEAGNDSYLTISRNSFPNKESLKYGAVYYPFIKSSNNFFVNSDESNVSVTYGGNKVALNTLSATGANRNTALYNAVKSLLKDHFVVLPPSGAVAGVYAAVDASRGVWKAPANVGLVGVIEPVVKLDNAHQDSLNVDVNAGKSVNAIRAFAGKGTLVWGARTLAGNDNEWRYVSVRRFFNMVEESVKKSTYWAVFEPNDANTWVKVRGMIENYLTQKWREGALAGATTKDAFFVRCGLGTTMTAQDILEGRMNVEIGMAVVRPAEFIILKFSHKLQTS